MRNVWPDWLRDVMATKDLNNKGLAALLDVSGSTVGNWLEGKHRPEAALIGKLADLAGVAWTELYDIVYPQPGQARKALADPSQSVDPLTLDLLRLLARRTEAERAMVVEAATSLLALVDRGKREALTGDGEATTRKNQVGS